ncbi:MAG TPA: enoyl-CoA hydratase/isomerase family protein [Burkholderiales bacterium]|nr:enoyl-CoA hydratase/isomerase family protein [Burkholderiales bacterium]
MAGQKEGVIIKQEGAVALVTLYRPSRGNLVDHDAAEALSNFFTAAQTDNSIRAVVITGTGKQYCTGGDVSAKPEVVGGAQPTSPMDYRWLTLPFNRIFTSLWELDKPVVSAVNGSVAGIGWMMALLADMVVAAEGTRWTHVFTKRGMIPHAGDTYFMPRLIPFHRLTELALLCDPVTTETLHGWGLINRLVPREQVLPTAMELATRLAAGPTRTLGLTKRLYHRSLDGTNLASMFNEETASQSLNATTQDRIEGVKAFVENRPPNFSGN